MNERSGGGRITSDSSSSSSPSGVPARRDELEHLLEHLVEAILVAGVDRRHGLVVELVELLRVLSAEPRWIPGSRTRLANPVAVQAVADRVPSPTVRRKPTLAGCALRGAEGACLDRDRRCHRRAVMAPGQRPRSRSTLDEVGDTIIWPTGADLDPDVIYGNSPPDWDPPVRITVPQRA
jgi:hypothetical protein